MLARIDQQYLSLGSPPALGGRAQDYLAPPGAMPRQRARHNGFFPLIFFLLYPSLFTVSLYRGVTAHDGWRSDTLPLGAGIGMLSMALILGWKNRDRSYVAMDDEERSGNRYFWLGRRFRLEQVRVWVQSARKGKGMGMSQLQGPPTE